MGFDGFPKAGLKFLADLEKHNDRDWFQPRKDDYATLVHGPMVELVSVLSGELAKISPAHAVGDPRKFVSRVYRDIRFSKDKRPYNTRVWAHFPRSGALRGESAGFYVAVESTGASVGGGIWQPPPPVLARLRAAIDRDPGAFTKVLDRKAFRAAFKPMDVERLSRVPRGFAPDHPAAELLKQKSIAYSTAFDVATTVSPKLVKEIAAAFKLAAPIIELLDEAAAA